MSGHFYNPFSFDSAETVAQRLSSLIPESRPLSEAEKARQAAEHAAWCKARFGPLPADTYRILDCGSLAGWYFDLELEGERITLKTPAKNEFAVHRDRKLALALARAVVESKCGDVAAERASFFIVTSGEI
jgi:hypothetical protein